MHKASQFIHTYPQPLYSTTEWIQFSILNNFIFILPISDNLFSLSLAGPSRSKNLWLLPSPDQLLALTGLLTSDHCPHLTSCWSMLFLSSLATATSRLLASLSWSSNLWLVTHWPLIGPCWSSHSWTRHLLTTFLSCWSSRSWPLPTFDYLLAPTIATSKPLAGPIIPDCWLLLTTCCSLLVLLLLTTATSWQFADPCWSSHL